MAKAVAEAPASATPLDAVVRALDASAPVFEERGGDQVRVRQAVIAANPVLRERELIKLAGLAAAVTGALHDRGVGEPVASLAAEVGMAVFRVAFARWLDQRDRTFSACIHECAADVTQVIDPGATRTG
jgi:hypothetical protein